MKEQILKLREEGKTYSEIQKELGCSKGTISYHCGEGQKEKSLIRTQRTRGTLKGSILKKIDNFKNKSFKTKFRDFQRDRNGGGRWFNNGKYNEVFTLEKLYEKITNNPKCYLTGDKINLNLVSSYSFDHIIPISKGGSSTIDNLGLCLKQANYSKSDLLLEEYIELCKKVLENNGYIVTKKVV